MRRLYLYRKGKDDALRGWCEIEKLFRAASEEQDEGRRVETALPPLAEGQTLTIRQRRSPSVTRSPESIYRRYASSAMENAGEECRRTQSAKG